MNAATNLRGGKSIHLTGAPTSSSSMTLFLLVLQALSKGLKLCTKHSSRHMKSSKE